MVRRPYGTVCWSCARYIDVRGVPAASMIPKDLRRPILDHFTWGSLRAELDNRVIEDDGSDPFDFLFQDEQSNTSSQT
jgi:hypothetical protein